MTRMLWVLITLSLSGSVMILLLLALRRLLGGKLSRTWQYYIWLVAAARLLIPLAPPVNLIGEVFSGASRPAAAAQRRDFSDMTYAVTPAAAADDTENAPAAASVTLGQALAFVWAAGALALMVRNVSVYRSFVQFVRAGARETENPSILDTFAAAFESSGARRAPPVYVNPVVTSPMLVGLFRPFIVIPTEELSEEESYYIFLHELCHLGRKDILFKWLIQFTACIHWFNPMMALLRRETDRECELSCDEQVLRRVGDTEKWSYGNMLMSSLAPGKGYTNAIVSVTLNEDARLVKERLESIMAFTQRGRTHAAACVLMSALITCAAAVCGCAAAPGEQKSADKDPASVQAAERGWANSWKDEYWTTAVKTNQKGKTNGFFHSQYYFENAYIFRVSWNIDADDYPAARQILADGRTVTVSFEEAARAYADDSSLMEAVRKAVETEVMRRDGAASLQTPLISDITGPYRESADELAQKFFDADQTARYAAVVQKAGQKTIERLTQAAYDQRKTALLSITSDELGKEQNRELARRAYRDGETAFFSILSDSLSDTECAQLAKQAYQDGETAFFSMLSDSLSDAECAQLAKQAYQDGETAFFSMLSDSLSDAECAQLAKQAYRDGETAFFSMLSDYLSESECDSLAEQAYEEGKVSFFSMLADSMSSAQTARLKERAFQDGEIAFLSILLN